MPHLNPVTASESPHATTTHCRNCGTSVSDKFCPGCGQHTALHLPSAGEFLHEFIGHTVALEGKLLQTLAVLVARPGRLTADYIEGKCARYIQPLRLYLTLSLVFFALLKICGIALPQLTLNEHAMGVEYSKVVNIKTAQGDYPTATLHATLHDDGYKDTGDHTVSGTVSSTWTAHDVFDSIRNVSPAWRRNVDDFLRQNDQHKSEMLNGGFMEYLPYMLIAAMPLFAAYLKLIYLGSGRQYGEHLLFALHSNGYAFLMASVIIILPGSALWCLLNAFMGGSYTLISAWDWLQLLPLACLLAYLPLAMQRVYGGRRWVTAARSVLLLTVHLTVVAMATVAAEAIVILGRA